MDKKMIIIIYHRLMFSYIIISRQKIDKRWINRKWHVSPINKLRRSQGDHDNLFQEAKKNKVLFHRMTRMSLESFNRLLNMVRPFLLKRSSRALPPELRLSVTLRFLTTGDMTASLALAYRIGESTVRHIIKEVCPIIVNVLKPRVLSPPKTKDWEQIMKGYWQKWNVPNCLGSFDGKHITIQCPPNSGSLYFNYKKSFSIVLMAGCDHNCRFTLVDIGAYGRNSDGGVFQDSDIGIMLRDEALQLPEGKSKLPGSDKSTTAFFLADDAFPQSNRVIKPFAGRFLDERKRICNYRISRGRRTIENSFGILVSRFRIFRRPICNLPQTADYIVSASVCLHNYIIMEELGDSQDFNNESSSADLRWKSVAISGHDFRQMKERDRTAEGFALREMLADYFLTPKGQVEWQYDYIRRGQYGDT